MKTKTGTKVIIYFLKGKLVKSDKQFIVDKTVIQIPKIKLLNGKIIYGDECWWMTEKKYLTYRYAPPTRIGDNKRAYKT